MNRTFDFYEYAGIIIPGAVVVMALVWFFPESRALFSKEGVTFGEFGLFIVIAYAAGQLVQAVGN
jgi:ABC-type Fe3+ transport system permease subunit